jgi:hypothetical protein
MQTTIDIDEDILQAATELARATGRTTDAVLSEVLRQALGIAEPELLPLRDGSSQIRFDPAFEPTSAAILDLLERIEAHNDLGYPLVIPSDTMVNIERIAAELNLPIGKAASQYVEESLLEQKKWPLRDGEPDALRRPDGTPVITVEYIKYLQLKTELEDFLD